MDADTDRESACPECETEMRTLDAHGRLWLALCPECGFAIKVGLELPPGFELPEWAVKRFVACERHDEYRQLCLDCIELRQRVEP